MTLSHEDIDRLVEAEMEAYMDGAYEDSADARYNIRAMIVGVSRIVKGTKTVDELVNDINEV